MISYKSSFEYDLHHSAIGKRILENYEICNEIFSSENTRIYQVRHLESNSIRLLKSIRRQKHIVFDIEKLMKINHQCIASIFDYYESENFLYLIKEYVEGVDLENFIKINGPMDNKSAKDIIFKISRTIDYLHNLDGRSLIFRDLKPSNIIITPDNKAVLIDIITIREVKEDQDSDTYYVGSRGYSAPEQFGYMQSSAQADIYSLGATLFFIMTGEHPRSGEDFKGQLRKFKSLPISVKKVIIKSTAFNPKHRYSTILDFQKSFSNQNHIVMTLGLSALLVVLLQFAISSLVEMNQDTRSISNSDDINASSNEMHKVNEIETSNKIDISHEIVESDEDIVDINSAYSADDINVKLIPTISSGLDFKLNDDNVMKVIFNRSRMTEDQKDFTYFTVSSSVDSFYLGDVAYEIYGAVVKNQGLFRYSDEGFNAVLQDRKHLVVIIYDEDKKPIGYYIKNNIIHNSKLNSNLLDVTAISSFDDIDMNKIPRIIDGIKYEVLEGNSLKVILKEETLTDLQMTYHYVGVTTSDRAYNWNNFKHEIFGAIVSGIGLEEISVEGYTTSLDKRRNFSVVIYNENRVPLGYDYVNDIIVN